MYNAMSDIVDSFIVHIFQNVNYKACYRLTWKPCVDRNLYANRTLQSFISSLGLPLIGNSAPLSPSHLSLIPLLIISISVSVLTSTPLPRVSCSNPCSQASWVTFDESSFSLQEKNCLHTSHRAVKPLGQQERWSQYLQQGGVLLSRLLDISV